LEYAALLHDIGAFLSYSNHHAHTYYLIRNADLLGLDQAEIALIAATAYYHRKGLPGRNDSQFVALDKHGQKALAMMSLLLRIAENLDRSHAGLVEQARLYAAGKRTVVLEIRAVGDVQLELWGIESRKELLERALGRKLLLQLTRDGERTG
jgi:exopolyphosphatase/guanosine-5'-triphosphate,3'-diphosphate pyrophosphatase